MRKILVFNTSEGTPREFESDATTYGEIKQQVTQGSSYKVILQNTKATLEASDAVLPEGDITIFLFPEKVKSGLFTV